MLAPGEGSAASPPPLRDQQGALRSLADLRGRPVVALVVGVARLRRIRGYEEDLRKRVDGVAFLRIADVPREPPSSWERVARALRGRVPDEAPVLIDLQGAWAHAFELDAREVNLLVFDGEGNLRASRHGRREPALIDAVIRDLEPLLARRSERP